MGLGSRALRSEVGSSLTEALVATVVTAVGVLSVAVLFLYGTRLQTVARDNSNATSLATARLEWLRMLPVNDPLRANGSTTTNVGDFTVKWDIADGPAKTKNVTITVTTTKGAFRPDVKLQGRLWQ